MKVDVTIACGWKRVQIDLNERYGRKLLPVGREVYHVSWRRRMLIYHPSNRAYEFIHSGARRMSPSFPPRRLRRLRRRLKLVFETAKHKVNCKVRRHERDFHGILQVHVLISGFSLNCVASRLRCIAVEKGCGDGTCRGLGERGARSCGGGVRRRVVVLGGRCGMQLYDGAFPALPSRSHNFLPFITTPPTSISGSYLRGRLHCLEVIEI